MKYTNQNGELKDAVDREESKETAEWLETVGNCMTRLENNWWEVALKGEKHPNYYPLPTIQGKLKAEELSALKDEVYEKLLPAYRAVKESFAKRWWFEIIFNNRQYTAERDTLKVMTKMILAMTNDTMEQLNARYEAFKQEVPSSDISKVHRVNNERADIAEKMKQKDVK